MGSLSPKRDPWSRAATPKVLASLGSAAGWSPDVIARAQEMASSAPDVSAWRRMLSRVLGAVGVALILAGVVCFFAFNWGDLGRFGKFGLLEGAIAVCAALGWRYLPGLAGQLAITAAAVLVGPLIVVFGQTYQTGADSYGVFALWALLSIPWALTARFSPLWLVTLVVTNVALGLFWDQQLDLLETTGFPLFCIALAVLNGVAMAVAEVKGRGRWFPRVVILGALGPLVVSASALCVADQMRNAAGGAALLLWAGAEALLIAVYRARRHDTYMLAVAGLGIATPVTTLLGRIMLDAMDMGAFGMLLLAFIVAAEVTVLVRWLRREMAAPLLGEVKS